MPRRIGLLFLALLPACERTLTAVDDGGAVCSSTLRVYLPQNCNNSVDVLFVVEDTPAMAAMQPVVQARAMALLQPILHATEHQGASLDLHIGVITTDLGAGKSGAPGCAAWPGRGGKLSGLGAAAAKSCRAPVGLPYLKYDFNPYNPAGRNLPDGQDLATTLGCMLSVGSGGCGYAQPLEATRMALRDHLGDLAEFLRDEALLYVVYIGAQDDCSAPPETDLFDPARVALYGPPGSLRCARAGLLCGDARLPPPGSDSHGDLGTCTPAPGTFGTDPGKLYDLQRYVDFFTNTRDAGGIKPNPIDVVLIRVGGPTEPVSVVVGDPMTPPDRLYSCPPADAGASCTPLVQRSCVSAQGQGPAGEPAIRIQALGARLKTWSPHNNNAVPICTDDYSVILADIAWGVGWCGVPEMYGGCIPRKLPDPAHPDCSVEDLTWNSDGTTTTTEIPTCADGSARVWPCWRIETASEAICGNGLSPDLQRMVIDRNHLPAPDHTTSHVSCAAAC